MEENTNFETNVSTQNSGKSQSWATAFILCLFAGFFGLHRFYTGHKAIGLIQLFTIGGFFIWWLLDLDAILKGKFQNSEGVILKKTKMGCFWASIWMVIGSFALCSLALYAQTLPEPQYTPSNRSQQTFSSRTYYALNDGVRGRECPQLSCSVAITLPFAASFAVTGSTTGDTVSGSNEWFVGNSNNRTVYIHSSLLSQNRPTRTTTTNDTSAGSQNNRRPANCAEARAMGLTAEQAGQWSHLDRDNDGVACYGD